MHLTRQQRLIPLETMCNVRDIGGYETQSSCFTKPHKYVRAATPEMITEEEKERLYQYGVRVIIDLRSEKETVEAPNRLKGYKDIIYYHIDVFNDPEAAVVPKDSIGFHDMGDLYLHMIDHLKGSFKRVFDIFVKHLDVCILYHCSAGKDRTGVVSGLLLDLAGCHHYDIVKDYSESYENNKVIYDRLLAMMGDGKAHYLQSDPSYMLRFLDYLYINYGSAKEYLLQIGISEEDVNDLIDNFTI